MAAGSCCAQILWLKQHIKDYEVVVSEVTTFCDSSSAIVITQNHVLHTRCKHIVVNHHFICDHVKQKNVGDREDSQLTSNVLTKIVYVKGSI